MSEHLVTSPIPFESQEKQPDSSLCGAACLSMVLRSLGVECSQSLLWPEIGRPSHVGGRRARTHLICRAALERGLAAVIIKARDPWSLLRRCVAVNARAILSHRPSSGSPGGHYTVLLDIDEDAVWVHDPAVGPSQRIERTRFLSLWQPALEVTGHVLVGISGRDQPTYSCGICARPVPPKIACRVCEKQIDLEPAALLGCIQADCPERLWDEIFCPGCDWQQGPLDASTADTGIQQPSQV